MALAALVAIAAGLAALGEVVPRTYFAILGAEDVVAGFGFLSSFAVGATILCIPADVPGAAGNFADATGFRACAPVRPKTVSAIQGAWGQVTGVVFFGCAASQAIVFRVDRDLTGVCVGTDAAGGRAIAVLTPFGEPAVDGADHRLTILGVSQRGAGEASEIGGGHDVPCFVLPSGAALLVAFAPRGPLTDNAVLGAAGSPRIVVRVEAARVANKFLDEASAAKSTGGVFDNGAGTGLDAAAAGLGARAVFSEVRDFAVKAAGKSVANFTFDGVYGTRKTSVLRLRKHDEGACTLTAFAVRGALRPGAGLEEAIDWAHRGGRVGWLVSRLGGGCRRGDRGIASLKRAINVLAKVRGARLAVQLCCLRDVTLAGLLTVAASHGATGPFVPVTNNAIHLLFIPAGETIVAMLHFIAWAVKGVEAHVDSYISAPLLEADATSLGAISPGTPITGAAGDELSRSFGGGLGGGVGRVFGGGSSGRLAVGGACGGSCGGSCGGGSRDAEALAVAGGANDHAPRLIEGACFQFRGGHEKARVLLVGPEGTFTGSHSGSQSGGSAQGDGGAGRVLTEAQSHSSAGFEVGVAVHRTALEGVTTGCDGIHEALPINSQTIAILHSHAAIGRNPVAKGKETIGLCVILDEKRLEIHEVSATHQVPSHGREGVSNLVVEKPEVNSVRGHGNTAHAIVGRQHAISAHFAFRLSHVVLEFAGVARRADSTNTFGLEEAMLAGRAELALLTKGELAHNANRTSKHTRRRFGGARIYGSVTVLAGRARGAGVGTLERARGTEVTSSKALFRLELARSTVKALPLDRLTVELAGSAVLATTGSLRSLTSGRSGTKFASHTGIAFLAGGRSGNFIKLSNVAKGTVVRIGTASPVGKCASSTLHAFAVG